MDTHDSTPDQDDAKTPTRTIEEWVETIRDKGLSAFTQSVQQIAELADKDEADLEKLSSMIKQDAGLVTKILRASTSAYRQRRGRINTVSRALVMLGVNEVKKICLTCSLLDGLLDGEPDEELIAAMTQAFNAATQARLLAMARGDTNSEEVFLSALMQNVGPLALWRIASSNAADIQDVMKERHCTTEEAEQEVLGFTLNELSEALATEWNLGEYIPDEGSNNPQEQKRAAEINLSNQLVRTVHLGWESPRVHKILNDMQSKLGIDEQKIGTVISAAARETVATIKSFGVPLRKEFIPKPPPSDEGAENPLVSLVTESTEGSEDLEDFVPPEPDPLVQLEILRELGGLILKQVEPTVFIVRVLEAMHRGIGLDRIVFALLNDSRNSLMARLAYGPEQQQLRLAFSFPVSTDPLDVFPHVFESGEPFWLFNCPTDLREDLDLGRLPEVVGEGDFFLAPIVIGDKWLGVFYADRRPSQRDLTDEDFRAFNQFAMQAILAFQSIDRRRADDR